MLPLVVPYVVLGVGMLVLLKTLGLDQSLSAVLFVHVVVSVPYGVLVILPRLQTLDPAIAEAARDLGAGEITAFVRVTLPLILPGDPLVVPDRVHDLVRRVRDRVVPGAARATTPSRSSSTRTRARRRFGRRPSPSPAS